VTALRVLGLDFEVGGRRCGDRHFEIAEWQQLYDETELLGQRESALMTETANKIDTSIHWTEGAVEVDATLVARGLNLPIEQFMAEMRRGIVHSTSERGIGEDEGRFRLTFRYRDRAFRLIATTAGEIVCEESV
jgi:hypothetical protein